MTKAALYKTTIERTLCLLKEKHEWESRYHGYADAITSKQRHYDQVKNKVGQKKPFDVYLSVSLVKQSNPRTVYYDLRYKGQSVAELRVPMADKPNLIYIDRKKKASNDRCYSGFKELGLSGKLTADQIDKFKKFFCKEPNRLEGNFEHNLESQWLKQLALKKATGKHLTNIRPITLLDEYFQMPTPLNACDAKDGKVAYGGEKGGGIDILARHGSGKGTHLTVIELKDENTKNEPPEKAIAQAIAYATFLRTLLRTPAAAPEEWWKRFGFGKKMPEKLKIKTVIAMPFKDGSDTSFARTSIKFADSGDSLELHYIFFDVNKNKQITGVHDTSLKK